MTDYVIKSGDNLSAIAKRYGTTVKALQEANNIADVNKISAGRTLKIPDGKGVTVERTQPQETDVKVAEARKIAHQREIAEINAAKKSAQQNIIKPATKKGTTMQIVSEEMQRKDAPTEGGKKYGKVFGSAEYWTNLIDKVSSEFDIPKELLTAKVSREVNFVKGLVHNGQYGAMQIRHTAVKAMFPGAAGNWHDKYKELDEKLLNDILYKKDSKGNYIKDAKGNMVPKYSSWKELLEACKDDEISLKVGALYDKMQYAEYVTAKKYGPKKVYPNLSKTIKELKEKPISPQENLNNIKGMETRYNGSSAYGKAITDSIIRMGFNFREQIIKRT